jgi:mannose-6-phosphate isomerase class I
MNPNRPYLIIPKLIEQSTWGGSYIAGLKNWQNLPQLQNVKIGQSYELFSGSKLALSITDTADPRFVPEIGSADSTQTLMDNFKLVEGVDYVNIEGSESLLIKINHSKGNSFQLHVKQNVNDPKWQHKAESWYYLEPGKLTFGIKKGINIEDYKKTCFEIDQFMQKLSQEIGNGNRSLESVRAEAKEYVQNKNPWQFVNVHTAAKFEVVDPSLGGIHHSWEEDNDNFPIGNVVYEIQEDVMDPVSTIRSFDQGKIKDDGSVRPLNIDDYFKYLDTSDENNDINSSRSLSNSFYGMDVVDVNESISTNMDKSFHHIYVRDGGIELIGGDVKLKVGRGHSVFVPKELKSYIINPTSDNTVVLRTYSNK